MCPQGSILWPLISNLFLNNLFYFIETTEICHFADDNALYLFGTNISSILFNLGDGTSCALKRVNFNCLKVNPGKF